MTPRGAALPGKKTWLFCVEFLKDCPHFITLLLCFISFGSICGPIDVSEATILDVYLFSDCLNKNLLFLQNHSNPFRIC